MDDCLVKVIRLSFANLPRIPQARRGVIYYPGTTERTRFNYYHKAGRYGGYLHVNVSPSGVQDFIGDIEDAGSRYFLTKMYLTFEGQWVVEEVQKVLAVLPRTLQELMLQGCPLAYLKYSFKHFARPRFFLLANLHCFSEWDAFDDAGYQQFWRYALRKVAPELLMLRCIGRHDSGFDEEVEVLRDGLVCC